MTDKSELSHIKIPLHSKWDRFNQPLTSYFMPTSVSIVGDCQPFKSARLTADGTDFVWPPHCPYHRRPVRRCPASLAPTTLEQGNTCLTRWRAKRHTKESAHEIGPALSLSRFYLIEERVVPIKFCTFLAACSRTDDT
jgi:hypothetical protein